MRSVLWVVRAAASSLAPFPFAPIHQGLVTLKPCVIPQQHSGFFRRKSRNATPRSTSETDIFTAAFLSFFLFPLCSPRRRFPLSPRWFCVISQTEEIPREERPGSIHLSRNFYHRFTPTSPLSYNRCVLVPFIFLMFFQQIVLLLEANVAKGCFERGRVSVLESSASRCLLRVYFPRICIIPLIGSRDESRTCF